MLQRFSLAALALLTLALGPAAPAAAQTRLEWKFEENRKFYLQTETHLKQTMKYMGQETVQDIKHTIVTSFIVRKKTPDLLVLEEKIESIAVDPNATGAAPVGKLLEHMQGATFTLTFDPRKMQLTKFEGYDDFVKKLAEDPSAAKLVRAMLPEESLKTSLEEAFSFLPEGPVKKGDSWTRTVSLSLGPMGSAQAKHNYTYQGPGQIDGKKAEEISVQLSITYTPPKAEATGLPFQISKGDLKVEEGKGTLWFDPVAGRLIQSQMRVKLGGTLTLTAMGQDLLLSLVQEQTVTTRLSENAPSR